MGNYDWVKMKGFPTDGMDKIQCYDWVKGFPT